MSFYAGVEAGGTTWFAAIGDGVEIVDRIQVPTTNPQETIGTIIAWLKTKSFQSIGIACFGPIDLNVHSSTFGYITSTPKPHWENTNVVGAFKDAFDTKVCFETDVNAPAVYEHRHIEPKVNTICYITLGTGVGVGICINGAPLHGYMHPEGGHVKVQLCEKDIASGFQGTCPYHQTCVEGMASAGALAKRLRIKPSELADVKDDDEIWEVFAYYIGALCMNLALMVSPNVIVLGGGMTQRRSILKKIQRHTTELIQDYVRLPPMEEYIRFSTLSAEVGLVSSLHMAKVAVEEG